MSHISVIIPVFREELLLLELRDRLRSALSSITEDFEVILVDDGSVDGSWNVIHDISEEDSRIKAIRFTRNFGQHYAITAGLDACDGDWVVVMDGDLQDRPEVIPELYAKVQEGYDVVFVARQNRPESRLYQLAQRTFYAIFRYLAATEYNPEYGNFSIMSRAVVKHFRSLHENLRFYGAIVHWLGFRHASIQAEHGTRYAGTSVYTLGSRIRLAATIIVAYSDKPLRLSIGLGLVMATLSFLYGGYIVLRAIFGDLAVQGWASLIVSIYLVGGILMVVLGIIGIYIGKMYNEMKRRPLYVVAETVGFQGQNAASTGRSVD